MKIKNIFPFLVVLIFFSCLNSSQKRNQKIEGLNYKVKNLTKILRVENGINRGLAFFDSLENKQAITYIPISITNDGNIPIRFQIVFSTEYEHPLSESDENFRLVLLPKEWTIESKSISDRLINEISNYSTERILNKTLKPGENSTFSIGTLRPSPAKICGIIPNALFVNEIKNFNPNCYWQME